MRGNEILTELCPEKDNECLEELKKHCPDLDEKCLANLSQMDYYLVGRENYNLDKVITDDK